MEESTDQQLAAQLEHLAIENGALQTRTINSPQSTEVKAQLPRTYEQAFDDLEFFAGKLRGNNIFTDESDCTRKLAGPFSRGGLLILLLEPRWNHPWVEGVEAVIESCATLQALEEGVEIGSRGTLNLLNDVSLIDLWPFLHSQIRPEDESTKQKLQSLVFTAIEAKEPDVLLCMGFEAQQAHKTRKANSSYRLRCPLYAKHPSHSVNYEHTQNILKRSELLHAISKACQSLPGGMRNQNIRGQLNSTSNPPKVDQFDDEKHLFKKEDLECITQFLKIIMKLCFGPHLILPRSNIDKSRYRAQSRYYLEESHEQYLDKLEESQESKAVVVVFREMNSCFQRISWFQNRYRVDVVQVSQCLQKHCNSEFEKTCYMLAKDEDIQSEDSSGNEVKLEIGPVDAFRRMERITRQANRLWQDRKFYPVSNGIYQRFADED
ncbi:hypothetical protein BDV95DRAFT_619974 [Massariosphaeria phaeospora]|uniref:Uracil-DNA glycosylase-like domain-containing protein n=1 Tax=Massariosphaeria phaeospora TaxID=100035 RepID=A0A7C8MLZ0_9PLEO|nr:hypothetical protein BDV95DRAFT_619974 [Massariosphaeria phaeospora]